MRTVLKSKTKEITIDTSGPITIIGENINPTRRKKLTEALLSGRLDYVFELAEAQIAAGADVLDINVGAPGVDEVTMLPLVALAVAERFDVPICLDSSNRAALAAALKVVPGKPLVNSVNGEEASLGALLPIIKEYEAAVIGLTMDDAGIPNDPEVRLSIAGRILERAAQIGIPTEDVVIDPLVLSVGADQKAGRVTLTTIEMVRREFGININLGASNVSFGLPDRHTVNQAFLALAAGAGASCVITNPEKLTPIIRAADLLLGRDAYPRVSSRISANGRRWAWSPMELQQNLDLIFDVDAVLRGEGAEAPVLRARSPALVNVAEQAMQEGSSLLCPKVIYKEFAVEGVRHERLLLDGGQYLESKLLVQHLAAAKALYIVLCTIGEALETRVSRIWEANPVYALALDGVGSAAVEALANAACQYFEKEAAEKGLQVSIPLSPGMVDWPVEEGQPQIFRLLGEAGAAVRLTPSYIMIPRKSLTMIMGIGAEMKSAGRACDYCAMRESCRYQDHYAVRPLPTSPIFKCGK